MIPAVAYLRLRRDFSRKSLPTSAATENCRYTYYDAALKWENIQLSCLAFNSIHTHTHTHARARARVPIHNIAILAIIVAKSD